MDTKFTIGTTIQILSDTISLSAFTSADGKQFYNANKKKIQRMKNFDISKMNDKDFSTYLDYIKKVDDWSAWAKENGYLKDFQQTAITDFYMTMFEAAKYNMPLDKNMSEHFFCYALAKVLYNQLNEYRSHFPEETKYEAMYWMLSTFDFFGDDERYKKDYTPIASAFALLTCWIKDLNMLIEYWEDAIAKNGKRDSPPHLKSYINKWKKGVSPSWSIIKLFFDTDLCPPENYFIDDEQLKKDAYKTFKANLYMSFVLTNLFDSLEKKGILSKESRKMIRDGAKLYFREFYIVRKKDDPDFSETFEAEAKNNLMFRTLFCMLDGTLGKVSTMDFLNCAYCHPEIPLLLD